MQYGLRYLRQAQKQINKAIRSLEAAGNNLHPTHPLDLRISRIWLPEKDDNIRGKISRQVWQERTRLENRREELKKLISNYKERKGERSEPY